MSYINTKTIREIWTEEMKRCVSMSRDMAKLAQNKDWDIIAVQLDVLREKVSEIANEKSLSKTVINNSLTEFCRQNATQQ